MAELLPAARALTAAGSVLASQQTGKGQRRLSLSLSLGMAPKRMFNDVITNQRSYSTMSLPFDELEALGKRVGGTVNTILMAMCSEALARFLKERNLLPKEALIAGVPVSLRAEGDDSMNNQVSMVRVDLATDIGDAAERFKAIHASSEAAKAVERELKPVLGVDMPITGSPWLMTRLASLYGRSSLARRVLPVANVLISNVPGPGATLYVAGARMMHFYPVSIPYHGSALQSLAQRRGEILRERLAQWQDALKDATGKDAISKQTEAAQRGVQRAVDNFRELAQLEAQARTNSWKVVQDRLNETTANLQLLQQPKK